MKYIHCRPNTPSEMRVWTEEMAAVGQFEIINHVELMTFYVIWVQLNLGRFIIHHDDCDGLNANCTCPRGLDSIL